MTSGLFASYEEDFNETLQQAQAAAAAVQASIKQQESKTNTNININTNTNINTNININSMSRAQNVQALQHGLAHLRELLTSMLYESNDISSTTARTEAKQKIEEFKQQVMKLEKETVKLRQQAREADRLELTNNKNLRQEYNNNNYNNNNNSDIEDDIDENKARMLENTSKLRGGTSTLQKAEAILYNTNELGTETLNSLRSQTETMRNFHTTMHDVDADLVESRRLVNRMQRTVTKHKVILSGLILFVVLAIVGILSLR